jgi:hypothetical protein
MGVLQRRNPAAGMRYAPRMRSSPHCRSGAPFELAFALLAVPDWAIASSMPGGEGIVLAMLLLPAAAWFALLAVLLLARAFRHRGAMLIGTGVSVLAAALAAFALVSIPSPAGATLFLVAAFMALVFGVLAPALQYHAARRGHRWLRNAVMAIAALELAAPLGAWLSHEMEMANFERRAAQFEKRGLQARPGDLAAVVGSNAESGITTDFMNFREGLQRSQLLLGDAPLRDDDRAAARSLIANRNTYSNVIHAKLVWDSYRGEPASVLLTDADAPMLRYPLLVLLERHGATRYCADAVEAEALRAGVRAWYGKGTLAGSDAKRIDALCAQSGTR